MKEITSYVCEICGTGYKEIGDCKRCEESHIKIKKIERAQYAKSCKYPMKMTVEFEDGERIEYGKIQCRSQPTQ